MKKKLSFLMVSTLILAFVLALGAVDSAKATDPGPDPILVTGNPSCATLNESTDPAFASITSNFGFKLDGAPGGTFTLTNPPGELTGGAPADPGNAITISNVVDSPDGQIFDWSATLGIDAIIVKGGDGANAYVYIPEAGSDLDLHAPENLSGKYANVSHIEFCYDYELTVKKDADPTYTRTYNWEIEKSVTPESWTLFKGDSGTSDYVVEVTKTGYTDSEFAVKGTITILNQTPLAATITGVEDVISGGIVPLLNCGVTFPYELAAGGKLECTYETDLPDAENRLNTAAVTTEGAVGGGEAQADIIFGDPTKIVNGEVTVTDSKEGDLGKTSAGKKFEYSHTFTCDGDEGAYENTATIVETGQEASASVEVACYDLTVDKDADTSFTRTWDWTIDKIADQTELVLSPGQIFDVGYEVTVSAEKTDSDHAVAGKITVTNPAPIDAWLDSVTDLVSPDIAAEVDCGVSFPYMLAAGEKLECTYEAALPDAESRVNSATANLKNFAYDSSGTGSYLGITAFTGSADVDFALAKMAEIDECVDVTDTNTGPLGTVCAADAPKAFYYSLSFGQRELVDYYLLCGENIHTNTASFTTNDTQSEGAVSWTLKATVECMSGCTLTQGYWKTHSEYGPAPYDDTWALLPQGADTPFFLSGKSWYEVLWTPPQGGNAYYILANQYIAARLNILNGADTTPEVEAALAWAEDNLFEVNTPGDKLSKTLRNEALKQAALLDGYNMGLVGPGHCSEVDPVSALALIYPILWENQLFLPVMNR